MTEQQVLYWKHEIVDAMIAQIRARNGGRALANEGIYRSYIQNMIGQHDKMTVADLAEVGRRCARNIIAFDKEAELKRYYTLIAEMADKVRLGLEGGTIQLKQIDLPPAAPSRPVRERVFAGEIRESGTAGIAPLHALFADKSKDGDGPLDVRTPLRPTRFGVTGGTAKSSLEGPREHEARRSAEGAEASLARIKARQEQEDLAATTRAVNIKAMIAVGADEADELDGALPVAEEQEGVEYVAVVAKAPEESDRRKISRSAPVDFVDPQLEAHARAVWKEFVECVNPQLVPEQYGVDWLKETGFKRVFSWVPDSLKTHFSPVRQGILNDSRVDTDKALHLIKELRALRTYVHQEDTSATLEGYRASRGVEPIVIDKAHPDEQIVALWGELVAALNPDNLKGNHAPYRASWLHRDGLLNVIGWADSTRAQYFSHFRGALNRAGAEGRVVELTKAIEKLCPMVTFSKIVPLMVADSVDVAAPVIHDADADTDTAQQTLSLARSRHKFGTNVLSYEEANARFKTIWSELVTLIHSENRHERYHAAWLTEDKADQALQWKEQTVGNRFSELRGRLKSDSVFTEYERADRLMSECTSLLNRMRVLAAEESVTMVSDIVEEPASAQPETRLYQNGAQVNGTVVEPPEKPKTRMDDLQDAFVDVWLRIEMQAKQEGIVNPWFTMAKWNGSPKAVLAKTSSGITFASKIANARTWMEYTPENKAMFDEMLSIYADFMQLKQQDQGQAPA